MLGLACRRGRHQLSLARAVLGCRSSFLSHSEEVAGLTRNWASVSEQKQTHCGTLSATGADLTPQNGMLGSSSIRVIANQQSPQVRSVSVFSTTEAPNPSPNDLHTAKDPDYFMKSRYDQESLIQSHTESGADFSGDSVQSDEDLLWRLQRSSDGKFDNVVTALADPQVLAAAFARLNDRRRNWTLSSNELEISHIPKESSRSLRSLDIDWTWFQEAAHQLRTGSYPFQALQRFAIARRGRGESRQWVAVRPKDQVIQEALRGVLQRIYEPLFSPHLRPGANVHSALKQVKYRWKGISWFLQFDVRIADPSSVQKRLLKCLREHIDDHGLEMMLKEMFRLGSVWIDTCTHEDMPEGSVLSPMLGNIYFHHLDLEIGRIQEEVRGGGDGLRNKTSIVGQAGTV